MTCVVGVGLLMVASPATNFPPCGKASAAPDSPRQIAKLSGWKAKKRLRRAALRAIGVGRVFMLRSLEFACPVAVASPSARDIVAPVAARRQNVLLAMK